jgi:hypothetical protein
MSRMVMSSVIRTMVGQRMVRHGLDQERRQHFVRRPEMG